ncbi:MAG TPA: FkbM family methyltransferase [Acidimicrobiales bacterium]|nr:FkbM family methyltransferase [Acidimicrobiales bacterium]
MPKVRVYGRELRISGDEADAYYRHLVGCHDATDAVLQAIRPVVGEDSVCLDVGANLGLYSLALGLLAPRGRVYAVEPSPRAFRWLVANIEANRASHVEAFQTALGDHEGVVGFHEFPFFTAGSFGADQRSCITSEAVGSVPVEVPITTLDRFVERHRVGPVDVVKIDVEGAEIAVLEGARETLARDRPTVLLEFNSFGLTAHHGVVPHVALSRIQEIFPHVFVIGRGDGSLARLSTASEAYQFLYKNGIHGPTDNLLCSFADLPVTRPFRFPDDGDGTEPSVDAASAVAELEAMRRTVSWRVTAPLRAVRAAIDRSPLRLRRKP